MQFIINGQAYDAAELGRITGKTALELNRQTKMGLKTFITRIEELGTLGYAADGSVAVLPEGDAGIDTSAVFDSEPHFTALLAYMWLSRRLAGNPSLTFDEACDSMEILSMEIVGDDDDAEPEVETPDPTPLPGSAPEGAAVDEL